MLLNKTQFPIMINANLVSAQNRKRLFWTNIKGIKQPEDKCIYLRDVLEDRVDESYYIKDISNTLRSGGRGSGIDDKHNWDTIRIGQFNSGGQGDRIYSTQGKSVSLSALGGGRGAKTGLYRILKQPHGTALDYYNDNIVPNGKAKVLGTNPQSTTAVAGQLVKIEAVALRNRGAGKEPEYNKTERANALTSVQTDSMVEIQSQIRKLTPVECERLQSLPDNYTAGISNSQRYKCLGNGFNCAVIEHILKSIV